MDLYIILIYIAVAITLFSLFKIPLNKWTLPSASIGGIMLTFAIIQVLGFYHPHSNSSHHYLVETPNTTTTTLKSNDPLNTIEDRYVIAWFPQSQLLRVKPGNETEIAFRGIPGQVFAGLVQKVMPISDIRRNDLFKSRTPSFEQSQTLIPVVIDITDRRYAEYALHIPNGSQARVAIYGREFKELAMVRKTLMRMDAWMNYLSPMA
ncbi:MAG: hypothetical protein AAF353_17265 [Pseudomonadota bacterium]